MYSTYKQKSKKINQAEQQKIATKWMGYKSLLFAKITEPWCKWVNSCCSIGLWNIMHSSLRSSCIMFHEPIEKHALTHTYWMKLGEDNLASICGRSGLTSFTTYCSHRFLKNHLTVISFYLCRWAGKSVQFQYTSAAASVAYCLFYLHFHRPFMAFAYTFQ